MKRHFKLIVALGLLWGTVFAQWAPIIGGSPPAASITGTFVSQAQGSGTPGTVSNNNLYLIWAKVVVTGSGTGTATEIGVYSTGGAGNTKFALYDSGGTRIAVSGAVSVSGSGWKVAAISVAGLAAGDYYVGEISDAGNTIAWEIDTAGTNVGRTADTQSYVTGPPASLPANANPPGGQLTARIVF